MSIWLIIFLLIAIALIAFLITSQFLKRAINKNILDMPNERSSHTIPTPRGGGISIVIAFLLATITLYIFGFIKWNLAAGLWIGVFVAVIGYLDDIRHVPPLNRILVHISTAIAAIVILGGIPPLNLGFAVWNWGWIGNVVGVIGIVWMINLYNFMDGIDGIASSEAIFVGGVISVFLIINNDISFGILLSTFVAAVTGFLALNFPPARIFMGDVGSGFLGYTLSILAIATTKAGFNLWVWIILLGVFIVDTLITLVRRIIQRKKWYEAHRTHAYQHATMRLKNHLEVLSKITAINLLWLTPLAILTIHWPEASIFICFLSYIPLTALAFYFNAGLERPY